MKRIAPFSLVLICILLSFNSFSQSNTGQICFIRATGYVGSAVNFRVFIDDSLACKMQNKTYSIHTVNAGEHTISANSGGLGSRKKSTPFKITVEEGKTTYVDVIWANTVSCEEITKNSAEVKLKKLKQNTRCTSGE